MKAHLAHHHMFLEQFLKSQSYSVDKRIVIKQQQCLSLLLRKSMPPLSDLQLCGPSAFGRHQTRNSAMHAIACTVASKQ